MSAPDVERLVEALGTMLLIIAAKCDDLPPEASEEVNKAQEALIAGREFVYSLPDTEAEANRLRAELADAALDEAAHASTVRNFNKLGQECNRLVEALTNLLKTGLRGADEYRLVMMACKGDVLTEEENANAEAFGAAVKQAKEALAALSSHPDPIPASADIAGRLAKALEAMLCMMDYGSKPQKFDAALTWRQNDEKARALAEAALAAYRSNPSGWIPVGERLPEKTRPLEIELRDGSILRNVTYHGGYGWRWWASGHGAVLLCSDCIVKWKPLPPPPQEGHSGRIYTDPEEIEAAQRQMREGKA